MARGAESTNLSNLGLIKNRLAVILTTNALFIVGLSGRELVAACPFTILYVLSLSPELHIRGRSVCPSIASSQCWAQARIVTRIRCNHSWCT